MGKFGCPLTDVPQSLLDELAIYRLAHPGEGYVFRDRAGRPLDPDRWHRQHLVPLLERAQLRLPGTGLHSLRHTYTSLLAAQGEDVRYIADQLGHSSPALTMAVYQHVFTRARTAAMRRLDAAIPSGKNRADQSETPGTARITGNTSADIPNSYEADGTVRMRGPFS